jgi:hypothetical protein
MMHDPDRDEDDRPSGPFGYIGEYDDDELDDIEDWEANFSKGCLNGLLVMGVFVVAVIFLAKWAGWDLP